MAKRYTIVHAIETGGPGGAETVLLNLASRLDGSRFRSIALVPDDRWLNQSLQERGVPTVVANAAEHRGKSSIALLASLVKREGADLIASHLPDQNFYSAMVARKTGCKAVLTYHGKLDRSTWKARLKLYAARRWSDAAVGVSQYMERSLREAGFPESKVFCIYNGVDATVFQPHPSGRLRRELGCGNGAPIVGMVANLRQSKGYEHFVQAAARVAEHEPQVRFVAVGEYEPTLKARLESEIGSAGLANRFTLLGFRNDVPQILSDLDVFVLSSTSEGFSIATIEAMAAGKPVVVTRSGGPEEIVTDGLDGLLVPPADPEALAEGIRTLLRDRARAVQIGCNARKSVEERFSIAAMVHDYEQLYLRCLEGGR